jgi:5-methyltetrahydrofolate--homocysteine methyltransferase
MEKSVKLLKEHFPECAVMVGGAVLTAEYANKIGADFYGRDAMEAVRFVENVNKR